MSLYCHQIFHLLWTSKPPTLYAAEGNSWLSGMRQQANVQKRLGHTLENLREFCASSKLQSESWGEGAERLLPSLGKPGRKGGGWRLPPSLTEAAFECEPPGSSHWLSTDRESPVLMPGLTLYILMSTILPGHIYVLQRSALSVSPHTALSHFCFSGNWSQTKRHQNNCIS